MSFKRLEDIWEEDPEVQKIIAVDEGIRMLLNVLTAKQKPARLRSYRSGIEVMAAIEPAKRPVELFNAKTFAQTKSEEVIPVLTEALENGTCNRMTKEKIGILDKFFTHLEIEFE